MDANTKQRTIARSVIVSGIGYWSGQDVRVEFYPAPPGTGLVFVRTDLPGQPRIPATIEHRTEADRRTNLCVGTAAVEMVEHVLAALSGLRIDNCEIRVDAPEMPGLDGSSLEFVRAIRSVGALEQDTLRRSWFVHKPVRLSDGPSWIEARPSRSGRTMLEYSLDFGPDNAIGRQRLAVVLSPDVFSDDLAPARTFLFKREADALRSRGLGLRASVEDLLVFDESGPMGNPLRYRDECVRHKLLDLVGDLALGGYPFAGRFIAHRSGHRLNAELVRAVLAQSQETIEGKRCA